VNFSASFTKSKDTAEQSLTFTTFTKRSMKGKGLIGIALIFTMKRGSRQTKAGMEGRGLIGNGFFGKSRGMGKRALSFSIFAKSKSKGGRGLTFVIFLKSKRKKNELIAFFTKKNCNDTRAQVHVSRRRNTWSCMTRGIGCRSM